MTKISRRNVEKFSGIRVDDRQSECWISLYFTRFLGLPVKILQSLSNLVMFQMSYWKSVSINSSTVHLNADRQFFGKACRCLKNKNFPISLDLNGHLAKKRGVGDIFRWSIAKMRESGCLRRWWRLAIRRCGFGLMPSSWSSDRFGKRGGSP